MKDMIHDMCFSLVDINGVLSKGWTFFYPLLLFCFIKNLGLAASHIRPNTDTLSLGTSLRILENFRRAPSVSTLVNKLFQKTQTKHSCEHLLAFDNVMLMTLKIKAFLGCCHWSCCEKYFMRHHLLSFFSKPLTLKWR